MVVSFINYGILDFNSKFVTCEWSYTYIICWLVTNIQERKELIKGSYRDKHFNAGSILLGFGVFEAVGGGLNTWLRTGKLFPGPHLFAGAGN